MRAANETDNGTPKDDKNPMPPPYQQPHYDEFVATRFVEQAEVGEKPRAWVARLGLQSVLDAATLPNAQLNRTDVRLICRDSNHSVLFGYVCAMAWGLQRRANVKNAWGEHDKIADLLLQLRAGGLSRRQAYDLFCGAGEVKGLGPSYFTKLLYFFSPALDYYIMDQWTAKSINLLTGVHVVRVYDDSPTRENKGGNYQAFCEEVDHLAKLLRQTGDQIEQRLFAGDGARTSWRAYVEAHYPYDRGSLQRRYPHIPLEDL